MPDHVNPVPAPPPWRLLLLDRDRDDPKWILATVTLTGDVMPARLDHLGRYLNWREVTEWVKQSLGCSVQLSPFPAGGWRIREMITQETATTGGSQ